MKPWPAVRCSTGWRRPKAPWRWSSCWTSSRAMPFAHSEDLADQERSVALARRIGPEDLAHAEHHRDIVRRFGRFPHRNKILGRESTTEEQQYLDQGGYAG